MTKYRAMVEYLEAVAIEEGRRHAATLQRQIRHRAKSGKRIDINDMQPVLDALRALDGMVESYQKRRSGNGTNSAL